MKKLVTLLLAGLLCLGLCTACAGENSQTVSTDGSTSMKKAIGILSEAFHDANENITVTNNPTGSGAGIQAVREGRT